jgi:hypothetical protein
MTSIILGAIMGAAIMANFFLRSWTMCIAALLFGLGCLYTMVIPGPANFWIFSGVVVIVIGQVAALIIAKQNNP